jgi:hypothetical protein
MQSYKKNNSRSHTDPVTTTFLPKRKSVYSKFDIFLAKQKCQIRPVAYHYFSVFWRGGGSIPHHPNVHLTKKSYINLRYMRDNGELYTIINNIINSRDP